MRTSSSQRSDKPRVLYITATLPPHAVPEADHALHECLHLAKAGYDVHVLTTRRKGVVQPDGITVHAIMDNWSWLEAPKVWRLARDLRSDLHMLFFAGWLYDYHTMVLAIPWLAKLGSWHAPFITKFTTLGSGTGGKPGEGIKGNLRTLLFHLAGRWRYGALLVSSSRIVIQSAQHQQRLRELSPGLIPKTVIVPPSPILPVVASDAAAAGKRGRKRLGIAPDEFLVTFFGRLFAGKGIENLLEAVASIARERPKLRLAIVGGYFDANMWFITKNYPQRLEERTAALGLQQRVVWSGEYEWDSLEPSQYLYGSDVIALPLDEGVDFHNSSLAGALAHGRPIIATRASTPDQPMVHGENVYLIPPKDVHALMDAITTLMDDEALRARLSAGGQKLADEWFSWDTALKRILGPYGKQTSLPPVEHRSHAGSRR